MEHTQQIQPSAVTEEVRPQRRQHPPPPGPSGARDAFFDNAKYLVLALVACGHAWEPLTSSSRAVTALYLLVYAFHMPAFALICGYFSRGFEGTGERLRRLVCQVAVPYVLFETAYTGFCRWAQHGTDCPLSLLDPWYLMWFLPALFVWRLTSPLWRTLRHPVVVALCIAALASVSPDTGGDLSLQRVLAFLPCFVLGLVLRREHFSRLRRPAARATGAGVFAVALAAAYWAAPWLDAEWFYHRGSVAGRGVPLWAGLSATVALFGLAVLLTGSFLAWVPGRARWFTRLGAGTLYGYLLHGFVIKGSRFWGWYDHPWVRGPLGAVAVTCLALAGITLLCSRPVRRLLRPVVEPRLRRMFR